MGFFNVFFLLRSFSFCWRLIVNGICYLLWFWWWLLLVFGLCLVCEMLLFFILFWLVFYCVICFGLFVFYRWVRYFWLLFLIMGVELFFWWLLLCLFVVLYMWDWLYVWYWLWVLFCFVCFIWCYRIRIYYFLGDFYLI